MRKIDMTTIISLWSSLVVTACTGDTELSPDLEVEAAPGAAEGDVEELGSDIAAEPIDEGDAGLAFEGASVGCVGTSNPFSTGPRCCPRTTVLRPWLGRCETFWNLSPFRDSFGAYNGAADRPNLLPVGPGTLQVCAVYVGDNGEGDGWPHGPYGNLYVDLFAASEPLPTSADGADHRRIGQARQLRGPHRTHGTTDEWFDDELQRYQSAGIFQWGARAAAVLRVWESDGSEDGAWGRRNDVLGMELISRASTIGGVWIALHKYTNDHPRRRTSEVTGWLLLKTGGTCPR